MINSAFVYFFVYIFRRMRLKTSSVLSRLNSSFSLLWKLQLNKKAGIDFTLLNFFKNIILSSSKKKLQIGLFVRDLVVCYFSFPFHRCCKSFVIRRNMHFYKTIIILLADGFKVASNQHMVVLVFNLFEWSGFNCLHYHHLCFYYNTGLLTLNPESQFVANCGCCLPGGRKTAKPPKEAL